MTEPNESTAGVVEVGGSLTTVAVCLTDEVKSAVRCRQISWVTYQIDLGSLGSDELGLQSYPMTSWDLRAWSPSDCLENQCEFDQPQPLEGWTAIVSWGTALRK